MAIFNLGKPMAVTSVKTGKTTYNSPSASQLMSNLGITTNATTSAQKAQAIKSGTALSTSAVKSGISSGYLTPIVKTNPKTNVVKSSGSNTIIPMGSNTPTLSFEIPNLGTSITTNDTTPTTPISLPGVTPVAKTSPIETTPTAGITAGITTGLGIPTEEEKTNDQIIQDSTDLYRKILGEPKSITNEYQEAYKTQVLPQMQEVNNLKSQIGAIIAQSNADIMAARNQSATEGGTVGILSAREDAISRSSAIKTLPLAASLAATQDNLALAQDYLKTWASLIQEDIANEYNYRNKLLDAVKGYLDKKEQRQWDLQKLAIIDAYNTKSKLADLKPTLITNAHANKAPSSITQLIANAKTPNEAIAAAGRYGQSALDKAKLANTNSLIKERNGEGNNVIPLVTTPEATKSSGGVWDWISNKLNLVSPNRIKVKLSNGQTGTVLESDFDAKTMTKL